MGYVLRSLRTSAVDPTVQVSPATKMVIKGLFNTDAATQYVATMDHFQDKTWPLERTTRAEVGERDTFVQSALLIGVETCGKGPRKESLLRSWASAGRASSPSGHMISSEVRGGSEEARLELPGIS